MLEYDIGDIIQDTKFIEQTMLILDVLRPNFSHIENTSMYVVLDLSSGQTKQIYTDAAHACCKMVV